jgi:DNA-binding CsgD family transcriptional regulator
MDRSESVVDGTSAGRLRLTSRQLEILRLLGEGLTSEAISRRLGISRRTVTKHQEHLYRRLGTSDRLTSVLRGQLIEQAIGSRRAEIDWYISAPHVCQEWRRSPLFVRTGLSREAR